MVPVHGPCSQPSKIVPGSLGSLGSPRNVLDLSWVLCVLWVLSAFFILLSKGV
jgi:hypothetical protein